MPRRRSSNKTVATRAPVAEFISQVEPARRRADAEVLLALFESHVHLPTLERIVRQGYREMCRRYDCNNS